MSVAARLPQALPSREHEFPPWFGGKGAPGSFGSGPGVPEILATLGRDIKERLATRAAAYRQLVAWRKAHRFPRGLLNPAEIQGGRFDSGHLGPWTNWQNNLWAEVVIIGQDWGNEALFVKGRGRPDAHDQTSLNLMEMVKQAGWDLGTPSAPKPQPFFLTNAVLGIRASDCGAKAPLKAWIDDSVPFLLRLLDIIRPRAVVSLGGAAQRACHWAWSGQSLDGGCPHPPSLHQAHASSPLLKPGMPAWFAFYHCSPLGLSNRSLGHQVEDWRFLGAWLFERAARRGSDRDA